MISISEFENKASIQSDLKPFKLLKNSKGIRVWESENGLKITAKKIRSVDYFDVSIKHGERLGEVNFLGEKISTKELQKELSALASKYNFNYIKKQVAYIRKSKVGESLYKDWKLLVKRLTIDKEN